jgi:uncharacterized protein YdeI (BOF family)
MTLTQTAILTKRLLIAFGISFVLAIGTWISLLIYQAKQTTLPPKLDLPTSKFGILPKLRLPESSGSANNFTFSLDTETGDLPKNLPQIAKVFVTPELGTSLLAIDKVKNLAQKFGFTVEPEIVSSNEYRFKDHTGGQITINLDTNNFKMQTTEASPSADSITQPIPTQTTISDEFKSFLSSKNLLKGSLGSGRIKVTYDSISQIESNRATVTIWPDKLEGLEVVTPTFNSGLITATFSRYGQDEARFTSLNYTYWEPDDTNYSTYAIKTPQVAFDDLKNNQGVIIIDPKVDRASIISVRLAYFEPDEYPTYIQPVYLFEGPNFVAYVPAVTSDYIAK